MILCDHLDAFSPVAPPETAEVFTALALACEREFDDVVRAIPERFRAEHAETVYMEWYTRTNRYLYEAIVVVNAEVEVVAALLASQHPMDVLAEADCGQVVQRGEAVISSTKDLMDVRGRRSCVTD